ncbi:interleukin-6 receptor subunit alpha isoform X2 [Ascaphus truei]|uniref:interleukin-6 receptor subunit alpha isoform X2 n=1 Tax=Ascaphus truei TaxID=8439 RepID=UPI003F5A16AC
MVGAAAQSWTCFLHALLLSVVSCAETRESPCPKPVISPNSEIVPLGFDVTLTCPGSNGTVSWSRQSRALSLKHPNRTVTGGSLHLKSVKYKDVDNYTCSRDGHGQRTVQLLVREDLEMPVLWCYLRHPASNIRCEWRPQKKLPLSSQATLVVQKGFESSPVTKSCSYVSSAQKFNCRLEHREGDGEKYIVSLCVTSRTDRKISNVTVTDGNRLLQPDPPMNVTVTPMERAPRRLTVSWRYPSSWSRSYYTLRFQIQYRAENSRELSMGLTLSTSYLIEDAWMGRKHLVLVRAQEEYQHGSWSAWSSEARGTPWAEPYLPESRPTQASSEYDPDLYENSLSHEEYSPSTAADGEQALSPSPCPACDRDKPCNRLLSLSLCRHRGRWWRRIVAGGKFKSLFLPHTEGGRTEPLSSETLLMTPCPSPTGDKTSMYAAATGGHVSTGPNP